MEEPIPTSLKDQSLRPRVLFFGMRGHFSSPIFAALLAQNIEVCAIVLPANPLPGRSPCAIQLHKIAGNRRALPLLQSQGHPSIVEIAHKQQIPVWDVYQLSALATIEMLAAYRVDLICVACFSQRIPRAILDLPRLGCLNVHPSLLPRNRGPEPLFWAFREGHTTTGVTIHMMEERLDAGDIVTQEAIAVSEGIRYAQLEQRCAEKGGELLARTVWNLFSAEQTTRYVQDEAQSSYNPFPHDEDFVVRARDWDARHVYNFIRGMSDWHPVELNVNDIRYQVVGAISYRNNVQELHKSANLLHANERDVACRDGWVRVVVG